VIHPVEELFQVHIHHPSLAFSDVPLGRLIRDGDVMWLIDRILESGVGVLSEEYEMAWFPGDDLTAALRPRGLPIGNLTSQFWANCYLDCFDHFVKRELRCPGYVRYVDDVRRRKAAREDAQGRVRPREGQH
jgi:hypothetical protein